MALKRHVLVSCGALVMLATTAAWGQYQAGIEGTITDTSGGTVPGATVTITNQDTHVSQQTTTNGDGFYRVSNLPPGV